MTIKTQLWLTLFALTLTDFFLTTNLIAVHGIEVEANLFMRALFTYNSVISAALVYKLCSFVLLFIIVEAYNNPLRQKIILVGAVLIYTIIVLYSIVLTYPEWFLTWTLAS